MKPRSCAHPEWAVGDVDSAPGDHGGVLDWLAWSVAAAVGAVSIVLHVDVHRDTLTVLQDQRRWSKRAKGVRCSTRQSYLSNDLQRSFSSVFGVDRELGGFPHSQTAALEARPEGLHLQAARR